LILGLLFLIQHVLIKQPDFLSRLDASDDFSDVEINLLDGGFEPIGYYEGKKPVILVFWRSDIIPSKYLLDDISEEIEKWKSKFEFELIAVNVGETETQIRKIKEKWNIDFKIGLDLDSEISREFGISTLPSVMTINKDGSLGIYFSQYEPNIANDIRRFFEGDDDVSVSIKKNRRGETTQVEIKSGDSIISVDTIRKDD
jgi:peroxiredoxin